MSSSSKLAVAVEQLILELNRLIELTHREREAFKHNDALVFEAFNQERSVIQEAISGLIDTLLSFDLKAQLDNKSIQLMNELLRKHTESANINRLILKENSLKIKDFFNRLSNKTYYLESSLYNQEGMLEWG